MADQTELSSDQLDREELELLQRHALRQWQESPWLARERPRDALDLEEFPNGEVWLDVSGGSTESSQTPGAIIARERDSQPTPSGETRQPDLPWSFTKTGRIPARTRTVNKLIVSPDDLPTADGLRENAFDEIARVLVPGGVLVWTGDAADLTSRGFIREGDNRYTLAQTTTRLDDPDVPLIRETVLGRVGVVPVRTPKL